jgi:hypothetical protein
MVAKYSCSLSYLAFEVAHLVDHRLRQNVWVLIRA